ncbi:MAG TPA: hypothetical protein VEC16_05745 [Alphaproteobacteria bacterium]|nr:hypothetical protein [Alphaproteobacteria bacterium]
MIKKIEINKLIVNPENYRFDPVDNQSQAIDLMLEEKGDELVNLARHILQFGLDEAKNFRVIEIKKDLFKVLEGNRRLTTIKCLQNPSLIKSDSLRNKFLKVIEEKKTTGKPLPQEINCFIYKTEADAAEWIKLDHGGKNKGIGLDSWGPAEQNRYDYAFGGKLSPTMQAIGLLEQETGADFNSSQLKKLKITTIDRILSNPVSRSYLGIDISGGQIFLTAPKKEVVERLDKLFNKILVDDTPVSEVYSSEDNIKFIVNLFGDKPKKTAKVKPVSKKTNTKKKDKKIKHLPRSKDRTTIIPNDLILIIHEKKINNIYHELRTMPAEEYTNAGAVLFRVFLETSIDYYAEKEGMTFGPKIVLAGKIDKIAEDMEKKKIASPPQLKNIKNVASRKSSILSIDNFHEYVHSFKNQPLLSDLIYAWDNLQGFFEMLWGEMAKKNGRKK